MKNIKLNAQLRIFSYYALILMMTVACVSIFLIFRSQDIRRYEVKASTSTYHTMIANALSEDSIDLAYLNTVFSGLSDAPVKCYILNSANHCLWTTQRNSNIAKLTLQEIKGKLLESDESYQLIKINANPYNLSICKVHDYKVICTIPFHFHSLGLFGSEWSLLFFLFVLLSVALIVMYRISIKVTQNQEESESKMRRQLTQNINHELKTPISSVMGYLESVLHNPQLPIEKQHYFLKRSFKQVLRLRSLLSDISILNKLDDSRKMYAKASFNISELIDDVLNDMAYEIELHQCTVNCQLMPDMLIVGNLSLVHSIFRNLIENAVFYAGDGVNIQISLVQKTVSFYSFEVSDNGVGVSEEHLSRLFERFYRIDKGRRSKIGGTGLGLSIVKNAVNYHGGKISAQNNNEGGLTFSFTLKIS